MANNVPSSSPLSSAPSTNTQLPRSSSQQMSQWKSPRELPFETQQYVRIYLEESLFSRAFDLLLAVVSSDASSEQTTITVPQPEYLALAATLTVHPWLTTRTTLEEKWSETNTALRLLRLLLKTAGPVNSKFKEAFKFRKLYDTADEDDSERAVRHPFANEDAIWQRVDEFWAVVGWAFNCSCLPDMYAARWEHWQLWLEFMIDVLETDWKYHVADETLDESILWKYMSHQPGDNAQPRRIVRAMFADGSKNSLNEFREVFRHEMKGPKQEADKLKKNDAVNIEKEIYGDYLGQDDSDEDSENDAGVSKRTGTRGLSARRITPRTSRQSLRSEFEDDGDISPSTQASNNLGPPESISLRLRLMQLLVQVASEPTLTESRMTNFPDATDLYTLFVEFIRPLPLPVFQQFVAPPPPPTIVSKPGLSVHAHTTLLEFILQRILETIPSNGIVSINPLTQSRLETEYLPFAANKSSIDTNARVSLCIEGLLRNLANTRLLKKSDGLTTAVEKGIERRMGRVKDKMEQIQEGSEDNDAAGRLTGSSARIRSVVKRLKA